MSATTDWARKQQCGGDPLAKLVLITLSFYCDWQSGETWVSAQTIQAQCETCLKTVRRKLQDLVDLGLIEIEQRSGKSPVTRLVGYKEWHGTLPVKKLTLVPQSRVVEKDPGPTVHTPWSHSPGTLVPQSTDLITYHSNLSNSLKTSLDSNTTLGSEETKVWFENDQLKLCDSLNQFWLKQFDNLQGDLDLALMQVAGYIQPNSKFQSLEKQLSSQLSKILLQRKERDRRYQLAAKTKSNNGKSSFNGSKTVDLRDDPLTRMTHEFFEKMERGEFK